MLKWEGIRELIMPYVQSLFCSPPLASSYTVVQVRFWPSSAKVDYYAAAEFLKSRGGVTPPYLTDVWLFPFDKVL